MLITNTLTLFVIFCFVFLCAFYLPMQKFAKIFPSNSSLET
jgi:hypothetical protein